MGIHGLRVSAWQPTPLPIDTLTRDTSRCGQPMQLPTHTFTRTISRLYETHWYSMAFYQILHRRWNHQYYLLSYRRYDSGYFNQAPVTSKVEEIHCSFRFIVGLKGSIGFKPIYLVYFFIKYLFISMYTSVTVFSLLYLYVVVSLMSQVVNFSPQILIVAAYIEDMLWKDKVML